MNRNMKHDIFLAILAAGLYALNAPFSKLLLAYLPPTLMAGALYIAALALMIIGAWLSSQDRPLKETFRLQKAS